MPSRLAPTTRAAIETALRDGYVFRRVAAMHGTTPRTVGVIAARLGIRPPSRLLPPTARAVELVQGGMSYNQAARTVGVQPMTVYVACRRRGVTSQHRRVGVPA